VHGPAVACKRGTGHRGWERGAWDLAGRTPGEGGRGGGMGLQRGLAGVGRGHWTEKDADEEGGSGSDGHGHGGGRRNDATTMGT